jgi:hypothetical protein
MSEITKTNLNTRLTELEKAFKALLLDLYPEKKTAVEVIFPKPEPKPEPIRVSGPIVVGKSQSDQFVIDTLRGELASAEQQDSLNYRTGPVLERAVRRGQQRVCRPHRAADGVS